MATHPLFRSIFHWQGRFFSLAFILIFGGYFLLRAVQEKVLLAGNQAYYLLEFLKVPETHLSWIWVLSPLLGFSCILICKRLVQQLSLPRHTSFFFFLFLLLTPAFTFSFTTLTLQGSSLLLFLIGIYLFFHTKKILQYCSLIPFLATLCIDLATSLLLIALLLSLMLWTKVKERRRLASILGGVVILAVVLNFFILHQPLLRGPFQEESFVRTFFADIGSEGVSIFLILLAPIGIAICWKEKSLRRSYLLCAGAVGGALLVQRNFLFLAVMVVFFAAQSVSFFFERRWAFPEVKNFTLFIISLGVVFTFLISLQQQMQASPSWAEATTFSLMKEQLPGSAKIFSLPENSYHLSYFSHRSPFQFPDERNQEKERISQEILASTYITTTFPLLEMQNVTFLYLTPQMRKNSPLEQGLFFLLRNERFKLRFSHQGYEVWEFTPEK